MCESRAVPSGKLYRQLFDAQVQLSRSLLVGRKDTRTDCLSAEDSMMHCSATTRLSSTRGRQADDDDDDVDDVIRLPDAVAVRCHGSDIIERLTEKRRREHDDSVRRLEVELTHITEVCESRVRTVSQQLLSSLQDVDQRLDSLRNRMDQLDNLCVLWQQVEQEVQQRRTSVVDLNHQLTEFERQRAAEIRAVLRKHCLLLERISFLLPDDVHRLIHTKATMLNQTLLANRRSVAHLLLLLQEENLQQESVLRLHWEDCLSRWARTRVHEVVDRFRCLCSGSEDQQLISVQVDQTHVDLMERRRDIISRISLLAPPTCSTALVSDWFNQLTDVNQQIDSRHGDLLHQLRCRYEQMWQNRLAEVERCQEALSALQLSEEEVKEVVGSQLLSLVGRLQSEDEQRLAAVDASCDAVSRGVLVLSRRVFVLLRGAACLWETQCRRLQRRDEEAQRHLEELRRSQHQHIQRKKAQLDDLLSGLRQESSEDALRTSLDRTVLYLQDVQHSCRQCVSEQWDMLDRLPSVLLDELVSYSRSLSSFYHLTHVYTPSPEDLQDLHLSLTETCIEKKGKEPISCQDDGDSAQPLQDWLTEAESSLLQLSDINNSVEFTSSRGVAYTGPTFRSSAPDLQLETLLSVFPLELLTHTLDRTRTLFVDDLEQRFHDVLRSAVASVTDRKEAVLSELQLQQLHPQHVHDHVYQPRLAELQAHRQRVDVHCEDVLDVLTSCRTELQQLQGAISRRNQDFAASLSSMEDEVLASPAGSRLETVSAALQDGLDQHVQHTQRCLTSFRQTVHTRLDQVRLRTTQLLASFRMFSEGGDFAPREVKQFQKRLREETRRIRGTEESIWSELDSFESRTLQHVKEVSARFEDKLSVLRSEVDFMDQIQKIISSTGVHLKAESGLSNQCESMISSRLKNLKMLMEKTQVSPDQVSPDQVCFFLSSVNDDLKRRCQYLDFQLEGLVLAAQTESRRQVQSAPPAGLVQPSRTVVDLLEDPVVGIIRTLNRSCVIQQSPAEKGDRGRPAAGQRSSECVSTLRGSRSIRTDRRFQIFGPKPEMEQNQSFRSRVNSVLWRTNDVLLQAAEDFYRSERLVRFQLLPESLDQWAESMQQRLLGYQDQVYRFLRRSREVLRTQLSVLDDLLPSLPSVLISQVERQKEAELIQAVGGVRQKLEETLAASEQEKERTVRRLRAALGQEELQMLVQGEELRLQQLHDATCQSHLELQECVCVQGEEFVTSLASLTEKLLHLLDDLLVPAETTVASHQHHDDCSVAVETGCESGQKRSRTWAGILFSSSATGSVKTSPVLTTRCTLGHEAVIEERDAAVKRFEQLVSSEILRSDDDKRKQLSEINNWSEHWRQETHTLLHTDTHTHTH